MPVCNGDIRAYFGFLVDTVKERDDEPRDSKRRCDTMLDFATAGSCHGSSTEVQKQSQQDQERPL